MREQVHRATHELLLTSRWSQLSLAAIATAAEVQPSTLYRRWGDLATLLDEVVTERLTVVSPLPDTGSLEQDLLRWATRMADDLAGPDGVIWLRASLLIAGESTAGEVGTVQLSGRGQQIQAVLDRARARGEPVPDFREVFELVIGPLYGYALFQRQYLQRRAPALVERLLSAR